MSEYLWLTSSDWKGLSFIKCHCRWEDNHLHYCEWQLPQRYRVWCVKLDPWKKNPFDLWRTLMSFSGLTDPALTWLKFPNSLLSFSDRCTNNCKKASSSTNQPTFSQINGAYQIKELRWVKETNFKIWQPPFCSFFIVLLRKKTVVNQKDVRNCRRAESCKNIFTG